MIYELRVYDVTAGKLPALNDRFAKITMGYFKKHEITIVGFFTDLIGTSNRLTYIVQFENLADRERKWDAFATDADRLKAFEETERDGVLVQRVVNTLMRPTSYSPMQ